MKKVIFIPGLGDNVKLLNLFIKSWTKYSIEPIVYPMNWSDKNNFNSKFTKLIKFIDDLSKDGSKISLVGCSAGASVGLNLFMKRPDIIEKVVSVCGRLRKGNYVGFRSLQSRSKNNPAFYESVEMFENQEFFLSQDQKNRILTIHPYFGDELVPADTSTINGVLNITTLTIEHVFTIYFSLFFKKIIIEFIKD